MSELEHSWVKVI